MSQLRPMMRYTARRAFQVAQEHLLPKTPSAAESRRRLNTFECCFLIAFPTQETCSSLNRCIIRIHGRARTNAAPRGEYLDDLHTSSGVTALADGSCRLCRCLPKSHRPSSSPSRFYVFDFQHLSFTVSNQQFS